MLETANEISVGQRLPSDFYWKNKTNAANRLVNLNLGHVRYHGQYASGTTLWEGDNTFYSVNRAGVIDATKQGE